MFLIPAIDLRAGACVRLEQGDFARPTQYGADPLVVAHQFAQHGARWLHLVDLDGAREGSSRHLEVLTRIARETPLLVEFGGGLRDLPAITRALDAGAARVVLGTAALRDPDLLVAAQAAHGERVVVGLDARAGLVAVRAWQETSDVTAVALAARVIAAGCTRLIYTDIATDGMLSGPNLPALRSLLAAVEVPVIASGGIANEGDLGQLAATGVEAAIAGKALYAGTLPLSVLADWN
ncbi:MAG TPA: 1-(5-phosphoribosyl)-5-[(5-phosphoribosylamino)methylideneamino]imidazole-4-carboxamide isomerase [Chloroflexota bacterium]|nr:1-(5-phosphoribosyl)-5-[(5-phosphoribosylamino)methylideneamino]imidazole-4-carboxamide isomerase [Chloroflexota bacterium]